MGKVIVAKIFKESFTLAENLGKAGISAKLVKGAVIVTLPEKNGIFNVPSIISNLKFECFANVTESGGGMTNTGFSEIVCGTDGEKLHPYFIPKRGDLCNKEHAFFCLKKFVTVKSNKEGKIVIEKHMVLNDEEKAEIKNRKIWEGHDNELPDMFKNFSLAVEAAVKKANYYHCREAMYIL